MSGLKAAAVRANSGRGGCGGCAYGGGGCSGCAGSSRGGCRSLCCAGLPAFGFRWAGGGWAQGAVTSPLKGWVPYVVIVGALILPDVAGFAVGGFKLDLKQAQDDIATLRQEVNAQARASSTSIVAIGDSTFAVLAQQKARAAAQVSGGQATGADTPWQDPDAVDA